jgi:hypothetical protein
MKRWYPIHVDQHDPGSTAIRINARVTRKDAWSLSVAAAFAWNIKPLPSNAADIICFFPLDYTQLDQRQR